MHTDYSLQQKAKQDRRSQDRRREGDFLFRVQHVQQSLQNEFRKLSFTGNREKQQQEKKPEQEQKRNPRHFSPQDCEAAHISLAFQKKRGVDVLPLPQTPPHLTTHKGWAAGISPTVAAQVNAFLDGKLTSMDHIPANAFRPQRIFVDYHDRKSSSRKAFVACIDGEIVFLKKADMKSLFEGQRRALQEGSLATSWTTLFHALELARIHESSPPHELAEGKAQVKARVLELASSTQSLPLTKQLSLALLYSWATDGAELPGLNDGRVRSALEQTKPLVPDVLRGQGKILDSDGIWTCIKRLERESLKDLAGKLPAQEARTLLDEQQALALEREMPRVFEFTRRESGGEFIVRFRAPPSLAEQEKASESMRRMQEDLLNEDDEDLNHDHETLIIELESLDEGLFSRNMRRGRRRRPGKSHAQLAQEKDQARRKQLIVDGEERQMAKALWNKQQKLFDFLTRELEITHS